MTERRPPEETIIDLIEKAPYAFMWILAPHIKETEFKYNRKKIANAWLRKLRLHMASDEPFGVLANLGFTVEELDSTTTNSPDLSAVQ